MVFMARAAAPILPGWVGSNRTNRTVSDHGGILANSGMTDPVEWRPVMQALLNTAVKAARKGGDIALRYLNRVHDLDVRSKARNEFVTQVDHAAEAAIIDSIRERYPDHGFLAEESGHHPGDDFVWIIDPLDGTTNFLHGFPVFSVSIALRVRDQLEVGVVYDPCRQELFTAMRGGGAQVDGRRIRVSAWHGLEGALIGTGFPYRSNTDLDAEVHGDAAGGDGEHRRRAPPGLGRARPVLRGGGPARRLLGIRPECLGHRGRVTDDPRGRRCRDQPHARRGPPRNRRRHRRRAESPRGAAQAACYLTSRRRSSPSSRHLVYLRPSPS